ncbi:MAG: lasso peptide biosynthesis PqqD family chaperone [Acidobacteriota bacterium]
MSTMSILAQTMIVRSEQLLTADMDDDLVIMSLKNNNYYSLDAIGKRIWQLIEQPVRVVDLCRQLTAEFEVEPVQCLEDVLQFLQALEDEGLVTRVP